MNTLNIELIADYNCGNSEGPLWHAAHKRLYWTDIETGRMFWYDPAANKHEQCYDGDKVGGFTVQADGKLLLFRTKGNVVTFDNGKVVDTIIESIPEAHTGRFNDVIADPLGNVFAGTMVDQTNGKLYHFNKDASFKTILENQGCPNGMAFSKDLKIFYYTHSPEFTIWQFDRDVTSGDVTNKRPLVVADKADGFPDGMTIDSDDHFWSARWAGSCVIRLSPDVKETLRIELPCKNVSSVTFGGENYDQLYLTTAGAEDRAKNGETAGAIYRVTGHGFSGRPEYVSKIGL